MEVLRLIAQGLSTQEIASSLKRTVPTIKSHRRQLGRKLNAKTRVQLVRMAIASGLASAGDGAPGRPGTGLGDPASLLLRGLESAELDLGLAAIDLEGIIRFATGDFAARLGAERSALAGRSVEGLVAGDQAARTEALRWMLAGPSQQQLTLVGASGASVEVRTVEVRDDASRRVGLALVLADGRGGGERARDAAPGRDAPERARSESLLRDIVSGIAGPGGASLFRYAAQHVASALGAESAIITEDLPGEPGRARTLALWRQGAWLAEAEFDPALCPSSHAIAGEVFCYPSGLRRLFPGAAHLRAVDAEGVLGVVLELSDGVRAGTLMACASTPMVRTERSVAILRIFGARLSAELERRRAASARRLSELRLESLMTLAPLGVYRTDAAGQCTDVNDRWCEIVGMSRESAMGEGWSRALHPDDAPALLAIWRDVVAQGKPATTSWRFRKSDGSDVWVLGNAAPELGPDGRRLGFIGAISDITDRRRAEEGLRESEERYRRMIETAQEGVWLIDNEGRTTFVNDAMAQMLGETPASMLGRSFLEFMREDVRASALENLGRRRSGVSEQHEFEFRHRSGRAVWVLISTAPLKGDDGRWMGAFAMMADITDRKQMEDDLRRTRRELLEGLSPLHRALEVAVEGVAQVNLEGVIEDLDDRYAALLGAGRRELLGIGYESLVIERDRSTHGASVERALRDGRAEAELRLRAPRGPVVVERVVLVRFDGPDGRPAGHFRFAHDVTAARAAEESFRQSQQMMGCVLNSLSAHVAVIDDSGRIVAVNRTWERLMRDAGVAHASAGIGSNYLDACELARVPDQQTAMAFSRGIRGVLSGEIERFDMDFSCPTPGGQRWYRGRVTRLENDGRSHAVVAHEDVTAAKQMESDLRESRRRYRALVDSAPAGLWACDRDARCTHYSAAGLQRVGRALDEALGDAWHQWPHQDDAPTVRAMLGDAAASIRPLDVQFRARTGSGGLVKIRRRAQPLIDENGGFDGFVGFDDVLGETT